MPSKKDNCSLFVLHHSFEMAKQAQLVHPDETVQIPVRTLILKCDLFADDPGLLQNPYKVTSPVSVEIFRTFISVLNGNTATITNANFRGLSLLCDEFHFGTFATEVSAFQESDDFNEIEAYDLLTRLSTLDEVAQKQSEDLSAQREHINELEQQVQQLQADWKAAKSELESLQLHLRANKGLDSVILSDFQAPIPPFSPLFISKYPNIFQEFRENRFSLLWRGSRDGFEIASFHKHCDGHGNTLMIVIDTKGNVFGGFTPVAWTSNNGAVADNSLRSFIFTLKNPHDPTARKFALKAEKKGEAIVCSNSGGPSFGDIVIADKCNQNSSSSTAEFGTRYFSEIEQAKDTFLTGSSSFTVSEVEIFKII
jgi:hypothetical protein